MRLTGEIRDTQGNYYHDSVLCDVTGVPVYRYADGELIDSSTTHYGDYGFECYEGKAYTLKTWVVPSIVESAGPVTCTRTSCDTPDTLVLSPYGAISSYPNPFVVSASIEFGIEETSAIRLTVRGVGGEILKTLAESESPAGQHTIRWDGLDDKEVRVPAGPYWAVLRIGDEYRYTLVLVADQP